MGSSGTRLVQWWSLRTWGLSESLIDAAAYHHHPFLSPVTNQRLHVARALRLATRRGRGVTIPGEPVHAVRNTGAMAMLGLNDALLDETQAMLPERLSQLQEALAG